MQPVYVAKTPHEKDMQRALLQWRRPDKRRARHSGAARGRARGSDRLRQRLSRPPDDRPTQTRQARRTPAAPAQIR
ncbi:MAG: hypothetical protein ACLUNO_04830 [Oscillospiraceae bacterium]